MTNSKGKAANRLAHAHSPYLRQHADNPVDWYPWSGEAFAKAATEDKPVFLSIGYSTCHWCHVMEAESFSDPEVAALMNETFICVKVDREERPDVDHLYMTTCQLLTGSGGWPLTIVMTPEKKPFFAGTYFPRGESPGRPGMLQLIPRIRDLWTSERDAVNTSAAEIAEGIQVFMAPDPASSPAREMGKRTFALLASQYDSEHGGFGSAPKFPLFSNLLFLLRHWSQTGDAKALSMVRQTLDAMRLGGIYDHLGYGFHRYSTDERWFAPHFEKMLYDQALAVLAYTEAFCATGEAWYGEVAREIISYVLRDLRSPEGGFFSAEDADSEGQEGRFYTWTSGELEEVLDDEGISLLREIYNTADAGNFDDEMGQPTGRNILYLSPGTGRVPSRPGMSRGELDTALRGIREKLLAARDLRIRPLRDEKVMTDWNGMMIAALARAAAVFGEPSYADAAGRALEHILGSTAAEKGRLAHISYEGGETVPAFLNDHACLVWGILELHQTTFRPELLREALRLTGEMLELFKDREGGGFFLASGTHDPLPARQKPSFDGPTPSGNAIAAMNLLRLARLTGRRELEEEAHGTFRAFAVDMGGNPAGYTHMVSALEMAQGGSTEVVIVGDPQGEDTRKFISALHGAFLPAVTSVVIDPRDPGMVNLVPHAANMATVDGRAAAYVCRNFVCQAPATDPEEMLQAMKMVE